MCKTMQNVQKYANKTKICRICISAPFSCTFFSFSSFLSFSFSSFSLSSYSLSFSPFPSPFPPFPSPPSSPSPPFPSHPFPSPLFPSPPFPSPSPPSPPYPFWGLGFKDQGSISRTFLEQIVLVVFLKLTIQLSSISWYLIAQHSGTLVAGGGKGKRGARKSGLAAGQSHVFDINTIFIS